MSSRAGVCPSFLEARQHRGSSRALSRADLLASLPYSGLSSLRLVRFVFVLAFSFTACRGLNSFAHWGSWSLTDRVAELKPKVQSTSA